MSTLPIAELATPAAPVHAARDRSVGRGLTSPRFYLVLPITALGLGALSLLVPSTPSYDPWSWVLWGRQIIHLDLQTTGGPTWKPLPVVFTTVFALFGKAAPDLWLIAARAGALMAMAMVFKVAATLVRQLGAAPRGAPTGALQRLTAVAPAVLAGAVGAVSFAGGSGGFLSDNWLGYSEGLMTAAALIAVDRHLDGRPRQAYVVGFIAALDRPEVWLVWGPYGLWLLWRDAGARKLVLGLFALVPVLWFMPEYWGSDHFLRGVSRAHHPLSTSSAYDSCPACSELVHHAWPLMLLRVKAAAAIGVAVAAGALWHLRRRRGGWRLATPRERALAAVVSAGLLGVAWFVIVAGMTQVGFSGNDRYLVLGGALVDVAGAVALGWAAQTVAGWLARRGAMSATGALAAGVALMAAMYLIVPGFVGSSLISPSQTYHLDVYQAQVRDDGVRAVAALGGREKLLTCGTVMTDSFQVPMLAYDLGVPILRVETSPEPGLPPGPAPNIILAARSHPGDALSPQPATWPQVHYRVVARERTFAVYAACAGGGSA